MEYYDARMSLESEQQKEIGLFRSRVSRLVVLPLLPHYPICQGQVGAPSCSVMVKKF